MSAVFAVALRVMLALLILTSIGSWVRCAGGEGGG